MKKFLCILFGILCSGWFSAASDSFRVGDQEGFDGLQARIDRALDAGEDTVLVQLAPGDRATSGTLRTKKLACITAP